MGGIKDAKRKRARQEKRKRFRLLFCALLILVVCIAIFIGVKLVNKAGDSSDSKTKKVKTEAPKNKAEKIDTSKVEIDKQPVSTAGEKPAKGEAVTLTVSSVGDCTLGTDTSFDPSTSLNAYYNARGADYFFQNVKPILETDDLTIVNMEGTLTTEETRADKIFAFKGPPEYASILTSGSVEAANLANNHSHDYGDKSFEDTKAALKDSGIATFGYDRTALVEIKGIKVGLTGIYELAEHDQKKEQVKENIAALKEAGAQLIIVNFHWGAEREYTPNDTQKMLAHLAIDEGADLVVGHHPHVLQGIEKYKDKYIAYSLGNFCFGGNSNPEDKDTIIFQQTFTITKGKVKKDDNINIIPCSISTSSGYNDYCPTPVEGDQKQRILDKVGVQG